MESLILRFSGEIWYWKGPAPFYFVTVPERESAEIALVARQVTYGWGVIPVRCRIGSTLFTTSLIPKEGRYLVPMKVAVRKSAQLSEGDRVQIELEVVLE